MLGKAPRRVQRCSPRLGGAAPQGGAVAPAVPGNFPRFPSFLCFSSLGSESVRVKNMFLREEEK